MFGYRKKQPGRQGRAARERSQRTLEEVAEMEGEPAAKKPKPAPGKQGCGRGRG